MPCQPDLIDWLNRPNLLPRSLPITSLVGNAADIRGPPRLPQQVCGLRSPARPVACRGRFASTSAHRSGSVPGSTAAASSSPPSTPPGRAPSTSLPPLRRASPRGDRPSERERGGREQGTRHEERQTATIGRRRCNVCAVAAVAAMSLSLSLSLSLCFLRTGSPAPLCGEAALGRRTAEMESSIRYSERNN